MVHFFRNGTNAPKKNYTNININDFESLIDIFYVYHMNYFFGHCPNHTFHLLHGFWATISIVKGDNMIWKIPKG